MAFLFERAKSKYFYAGWKDENGKRINKSTGIEAKASNRKKALKVAYEFEELSRKRKSAKQIRKVIVDLRKDVLGEDLPTATIAEYRNRFLDSKESEVVESSFKYYQTALSRFTDWMGDAANFDIAYCSKRQIEDYRKHLVAKFSSSTARNQLKRIRAMFAKALIDGFIEDDPTKDVSLPKLNSGDEGRKAFTRDELKKIVSVANDEWKSMIVFALYTGQRLGDVACIRWSAIELEKREVEFRTRKTGKIVKIPISQPLMEHILSLRSSDDPRAFLHPKAQRSYEKNGSSVLSNQFVEILADCGMREPVTHKKSNKDKGGRRKTSVYSFHSIRASAVTMLHESGVPASMVEQWVGHDSKEVNRTYVKHGIDALREASGKLPNVL